VLGENEQTSREHGKNHLGDPASLDLLGNQMSWQSRLWRQESRSGFAVHGRPEFDQLQSRKCAAILDGWISGRKAPAAVADVVVRRLQSGREICRLRFLGRGPASDYYYQIAIGEAWICGRLVLPLFPFAGA